MTKRLPIWRWTKVFLRTSFLPEQNHLIILAVVVGVLTGYGSVGFIFLLGWVADFARGPVASVLGVFGPASLVLLPAIGGLIAGPLIHRFAKEARGHGVPEVMIALASRGGKIRKRFATVQGDLLIADNRLWRHGRTRGPDGADRVGHRLRCRPVEQAAPHRVRTLVTCGAAGGIAATFNAPIACAIFSMEVLIGRVQTDFLLVLLTSLSSCKVARSCLGNYPAFTAPAYDLASGRELPLYFLMGLLIGWAAILYVRALYKAEDLFGAWRFPDYLKPAVGGLMAGLVLRYFPDVYGAGFPAVESALWVRLPWELLIGLFVAEFLANCATLGLGGSGGVFAPSLYMGAMLGGAFGSLAHVLSPDWTAGSGAYAMVGMAAFFAATAKAPTTSILILFEMTNDYRVMLPLMAATVGSVYLSHRLSPFSIYTLKLHRRGISYPGREEAERATQRMVASRVSATSTGPR